MKKSIIYLGIALVSFSTIASATNVSSLTALELKQINDVSPTPLCVAISKGEIDIVKKFVEYGADVNEKSNGMTPLMLAARYNKVEIIKFLLANGANVDTKDEKGYTALKYAELSSATDAIALLKQSK
jgi:ankyrin repeat protein